VRPICTQYQENDLAFLTRLLASEGLSWRFEHEQTAPANAAAGAAKQANTGTTHAKHCLVTRVRQLNA
jgi:type VI secretion system secreted protein VgrG